MNVHSRPFTTVRHASPSQASVIFASGVRLDYGKTSVLKGVDLTVAQGRTLALLGSSGCGKTTLLRLVAGLLVPGEGSISLEGRLVADAASGLFVPPERRSLGMVFQDYALWPHMTIGANVSFPLEMRKVARAERETRVRAALARVGLTGFEQRSPADLSGGQQQRVAIARAIVAEPRVVLFDEPLSNLDRELRETMVEEIAELVSTLGLTALYVTHDHAEAFSLADEVAVMRSGRVAQLASPRTLVAEPASAHVAAFLKLGAVTPVWLREGGAWLPESHVRLAGAPAHLAGQREATLLVPNGAVEFAAPALTTLDAKVTRCRFRGDRHIATVRIEAGNGGFDIQMASPARLETGERVALALDETRLRWFPLPASQ